MPEPKLPKQKKVYDPQDLNPCQGCSNCCEYIATQIDRPTTANDFDQVIWYLIHKDVWVYVDEENDWYIQFNTVCEKLNNRRCGYYVSRPNICREYEPEHCIRYGAGESEKHLFKDEIDFFRYLAKKKPKTFQKIRKKINIPYTEKELLQLKGHDSEKQAQPVGIHVDHHG